MLSAMSVPEWPEIPPTLAQKLRQFEDEHARVTRELEDPAIASDHRAARERSMRRAVLDEPVGLFRAWQKLERDAADFRAALVPGGDAELAALAREEWPAAAAAAAGLVKKLKSLLAQSEDNRIGSVMLEVRAGTGGDEAALWAGDILEMLRKYAVKREWSFEVLDVQGEGNLGGVRAAVVNVRGLGVWTALNFEAGVHSVKRVPATEAQGRVHTSTATVAVLPEPEDVQVKIDWANDVEEFATTSQGPGGQNVNKVATAVQVKHKPTGIVIRIGESKSQSQNRERARRLLTTRLYEIERQKKHAERTAARGAQIGGGERSEKVRTYRYKEGIVADERLPGEYALRDLLAGDFGRLHEDLIEQETQRRIAAM
jgi:peptide chain release factor 1